MRILRYIVPAMALICWLPMSVYGLSWLSQTSNTTNSLENITWGGSQYVAVGWNGTIVTSPDGATWTVQISNAGSTTRLHNVIWSGTQFVAVGGPPPSETGTGVIVTSPDGVTWTSQTSGAANPLNSVVWSGTQFVAVGNGGTIVTSPNGVLWTARTGGTTEHNNEVIWNGTRFVVVGGERYSVDGGGSIVTSQDGVTWTLRLANPSALFSVVWNGTQFVAVGSSRGSPGDSWIVTSPDGITWTGRRSPSGTMNSVLWSGSRFVAVGEPAHIVTSEDGVTWVLRGYDVTSSAGDLRSFAWSGAEFAAVGNGLWFHGELLLSSPDGVVWTSDTSDVGQLFLKSVVYGNMQFIAVGESGVILSAASVGAPPEPVGGSSSNDLQSADANDPVNTFTGELFDQLPPDLNLGGPMQLRFERYFAAHLRKNFIVGDLGSNWRHNFDATLNISGNTAKYVSHKGRVTDFIKNLISGIWEQQTNLDTPYQLVTPVSQDAVLYDPEDENIYTFDFTTSSVIIGKLVKVEDSHGNSHTVTYDLANGQIQTVSDGLGRTLTFTYNSDTIPKIIIVTDGTRSVNFQYTDTIDSEYMTIFTDARGGATTYVYKDTSANADHALMLRKTLPRLNVPFTQTYDTLGKVATQTDSDGNTYNFSYVGLDTTITGPLGDTRVHTHTATGEFSNRKDQAGQSFSMGSDTTGRRNSITDRLGGTTSVIYHATSGQVASVTNADGTTSGNTYTARVFGGVTLNDLTGITHQDGTTETFVYDVSGNLTSHVDQVGSTTSGTYNVNGQPLTVTNAAGGVTNHSYKVDATQLSTRDPVGNLTRFGYDGLKRLDLITNPDTSTLSFTYDNDNRPLTAVDENGNIITTVYDANGNLSTITDPLLKTINFTYDGNDRLLTTTGPLGGVTSRTYDQLGRLKTTTDENGGVTTLGYNNLGRLTSIADPMGKTISRTYDAEAIIASSTDQLGNITNFTSDTMGRITQTATPLGNIFGVSYDLMGRVFSTTDPLGNTTTLSRNARGLLTGTTLPGAISASYIRNALGEITALTDPNGNIWDRAYDNMGRQTSSTDPLANSQTRTYDSRNRPATITFPGVLGTLTFGYDPAGNLTSSTYSDGTSLNFAYDANNRLTSANGLTRSYDDNGRISDTNGIAITRDTSGRITQMTLSAGKIVSYTYDANNRVTQVADWAGGITTFIYDAADRLTGITRPNAINATRIYDNDSRLIGLTEGTISSITLTLDAKGQTTSAIRNLPLSPTLTGSTTTLTYDAASQVSSYSYDTLGRLTGRGPDTFVWDLASRLTSYTVGGSTVMATYDAGGRRLSRTASGTTQNYVWNDALGLPSISVEREGGVDIRYYIHTPGGQLLYSIDTVTNTRSFYHFDEMGNTLFVTNDAGTVIGSYAYSPYGRIIASTGSLDNLFTWQGGLGVMDEENGLYYLRARYYDSTNGLFISRDPVESISPKEVNPYQYALGNPMRFVDPSGEFPIISLEDLGIAIREALVVEAERSVSRRRGAFYYAIYQNRINDKEDLASFLGNYALEETQESWRKKIIDARFEELEIARSRLLRFQRLLEKARRERADRVIREAREARILHMKDNLDKAREKADKALAALNGSGTRAEHTARKKRLNAANAGVVDAKLSFFEAGGNIPDPLIPQESVVPELFKGSAPAVVP